MDRVRSFRYHHFDFHVDDHPHSKGYSLRSIELMKAPSSVPLSDDSNHPHRGAFVLCDGDWWGSLVPSR